MTSLDDRTIDAMSEGELRAALKELRGRYALMHRRAQVAPPAGEKATYVGRAQRSDAIADRWRDAWMREFNRVLASHRMIKEIYEVAAKKLGLPHGLYHSVSDLPFGRRGDGRLYANVFLTKQGGIETFDVVDTVRKAITP